MGRTTKPLIIRVHPAIISWDEWVKLSSQGHTIVTDDNTADLIVGPTAWHMTDVHHPFLERALEYAKGLRYPRESK